MSSPSSKSAAERKLLDEARGGQGAASPDNEIDGPGLPSTTDAAPNRLPLALPVQSVGEYELLERLRNGGMGAVYKARHRRLDKLVALKLLLPAGSHSSHESAAARFQREMKAVGNLDHPNVVRAYDAGERSGAVYLVMELIDGVDLERLVQQRGPLPITQACELAWQAALGLQYLHERGLIHRDVKPSNLMLAPDGKVKVLDLGMARWYLNAEAGRSLTSTGLVVGTPDFLSPEQIEKAADINVADIDGRADLYGLGGTLFYLLTGRVPFADHTSQTAKLNANRSEPPPELGTLRPNAPAELAELVQRLLAKKPEERFTTAAEVAAALAPFAGVPSPPSSSPLPPTTEYKPRTPRWPFLVAVAPASVSLVALTLLLALGLPANRTTSPPGPLQVVKLDVTLTRAADGKPGLLGENFFSANDGDTVTVAARLSRPAYAFLIAFRPDGIADVCFPESEFKLPTMTDQPAYPLPPNALEYGLSDGTGLEAFALVASSMPLPSFKDSWLRSQGCPWKKEDAPAGLVYRANGEDAVEVLDPDGSRGKGVEAKGKTHIAQLASWLRRIRGIETVQVLGFTVLPKEKR